MSKRTAEDDVAGYGGSIAPVSATRRTTSEPRNDGYSIASKKPCLLLNDERYRHKKRLSLGQQPNGPLSFSEDGAAAVAAVSRRPVKEHSHDSDETSGLVDLSANRAVHPAGPLRLEGPTERTHGHGFSSPSSTGHQDDAATANTLNDYFHYLRETSRHLVGSLSDLPLFVTVEGSRIASYNIDGEPYLCLPNLLQFIQRKYPIERVIAIFEETGVKIVSATPKQLEGLIKAIVLPPDAKCCPLIKRTDADRVCLTLFDQCSPIDIRVTTAHVSKCPQGTCDYAGRLSSGGTSPETPPPAPHAGPTIRGSSENSRARDHTETPSNKIEAPLSQPGGQPAAAPISGVDPLRSTTTNTTTATTAAYDDKFSDKCTQELSSNNYHSNNGTKTTHIIKRRIQSLNENFHGGDGGDQQQQNYLIEKSLSLGSDDLTSTQEETSSDTLDRQGDASSSRDRMFEEEPQTGILDLARAATSTLIIHVYHRCFGKCHGYYYPALFKDCESEAIECAVCHRMLSPRRFIGHAHGSPETNVCHWGFNSHNWRQYIHLSRKQTLNSLDDDELIMQIKTLKSTTSGDNLGEQQSDSAIRNQVCGQKQQPQPQQRHLETRRHSLGQKPRLQLQQQCAEMQLQAEAKQYPGETLALGSDGSLDLSNKSAHLETGTSFKSSTEDLQPGCSKQMGGGGATVTPKNDRLDAQDSHLIRAVSDLPLFVSIEDFRVASYNIDGEPYLCLPNLLQFIQQKYPIEKAVDIFEETVSNFVSATPKQIEGFKKAVVLPPDAKACPLIRRSEADRICLALFDQCSAATISKTAISLPTQRTSTAAQDTHKVGHASPRVRSSTLTVSAAEATSDKKSTSPGDISGRNLQLSSSSSSSSSMNNSPELNELACPLDRDKCDQELSLRRGMSEGAHKAPAVRRSPSHIKEEAEVEAGRTREHSPESNSSASGPPALHQATSPGTIEKILLPGHHGNHPAITPSRVARASGRDSRLFVVEPQTGILDLARAATSTLAIHVYHRCFGKCHGLYYPSLLKASQSELIECAVCRRLMTPRRFIGHTHGPMETNVCHWGFNSYNWRQYIQLSRKQTLNSLDDDELIVQLETLKTAYADERDLSNI